MRGQFWSRSGPEPLREEDCRTVPVIGRGQPRAPIRDSLEQRRAGPRRPADPATAPVRRVGEVQRRASLVSRSGS